MSIQKKFFAWLLLSLVLVIPAYAEDEGGEEGGLYGGKLVELAKGKAWMEVVLDSEQSYLTVYLYESDKNTPLYLETHRIEATLHQITKDGEALLESSESVTFTAYEDVWGEEDVERNTSVFELMDERVGGSENAEVEFLEVKIGEETFKNIRFSFR